jgi:hypothetical protein
MLSRSLLIAVGATVFAFLISGATAECQSPWNGTWHLDTARSSGVAKEGAPEAYRFTIGSHDQIVWEIPSLGEVVRGRVGMGPMIIHRREPVKGLKLSVKRDGEWGLCYTVYKDGRIDGGGRMMLVEDGTAWVDLTWSGDHRQPGPYLVYVKYASR